MKGNFYKNLLDKFNAGKYQEVIHGIKKSGFKTNFELAHLEAASWSYLNNYVKAKESYLCALKFNPGDFTILFNLAKLEMQYENFDFASPILNKLNSDFPLNVQVLTELGLMASFQGDVKSAEEFFRQAIIIQPCNIQAVKNLSTSFTHRGEFIEALDLFESDCFTGNVFATLQRAIILQIASRNTESMSLYVELINNGDFDRLSKGEQLSFYANYGGLLVEMGQVFEGEKQFKKALEIDEDNVMAHVNWGLCCYRVLGDYSAAETHFKKAICIDPNGVDVRKWYGNFLRDMGDIRESLESLRLAQGMRPNDPELLYNLALTELCSGELELGWRHFEQRWIRPEGGKKPNLQSQEWQGESGQGKSILIYREQGLGDELFFATCLPDLAEIFSTVVYVCNPKIVTLLSRTYPEIVVIPDQIPSHELALGSFDYNAAIGSVPRWLRPSLNSFPPMNRLLLCDPIRAEHWVQRLSFYGNTLKVGISWRSGLMTASRSVFYLNIKELCPIFKLANVTFVILQYQLTHEERFYLDEVLGANWVYPREVDLFDDLDASASLIKACDLVISVNASTAIISSAQGVPTLMLNAIPVEWTQLGTEGFPWLPALTIISKRLDQMWSEVVQRARFIIGSLAEEKKCLQSKVLTRSADK